MRKLFLTLLLTITIFITINGLVYTQTLPPKVDPDLSFTLRETSEGLFIELPLEEFRQIIINANTCKVQLDVAIADYNWLVDHSVPAMDYNDLWEAELSARQLASRLTVQRNSLLAIAGVSLAVTAVVWATR